MKRILISGISGFVGSHLKQHFRENGHHVIGLSRSADDEETFRWDPKAGMLPEEALHGVDVVVNLAGANIAGSKWSPERKRILRESRILSTRTLVEGMAGCETPPAVFISMSGVNYYPYGSPAKTETDAAGDAFLSKLCIEWESEAMQAQINGIRTVVLRLGVVLAPDGGAMAKMLPPFKAGAGGPIGSGEQGFPWISLTDLTAIIEYAIDQTSLQGPVNVAHPEHVNQATFAKALGKALGRPSVVRLPAFMVRLMFGQMGEEMLLGDLHVKPQKLIEAGYTFRDENLQQCLNKMFAVN